MPNGSRITPNGNGSRITLNVSRITPNGSRIMPYGSRITPNGNGSRITPNVWRIMPNVSMITPNGLRFTPNVSRITPNGSRIMPNDIGPKCASRGNRCCVWHFLVADVAIILTKIPYNQDYRRADSSAFVWYNDCDRCLSTCCTVVTSIMTV